MTLDIKTIAPSELRTELIRLKDQEKMDFLVNLIGMDWGEEGLGVIYMLESTETGKTISLKAIAEDKQNPYLPTVSDLWKIAYIYEREVFDFFGIKFLNHPDMRRLFLREDWVGYPMRKNDPTDLLNPLRMTDVPLSDSTKEYFLTPDGKISEKTHTVWGPDEYVVNVGPQHPSTHGVLHMRASLVGERGKRLGLVLGYILRGV